MGAGGIKPGNKHGLELLQRDLAQDMLDKAMNGKLCSGKRVKDATRDDLLAEIALRRKIAKSPSLSVEVLEELVARMSNETDQEGKQ